MIKCILCEIEKEISDMVKDKNTKLGYRKVCKLCHYGRTKIWKVNNLEKSIEYKKEWDKNNKEKNSVYKKKWVENNKELDYEIRKKYSVSERRKEVRSKYRKNKRNTDIVFALNEIVRNFIRNSFNRKGIEKCNKSIEILGCTFEEFKIYLESKFEPWMTWENRGLYNGELNYGWDIDHIIPISTAKTDEDIKKLNHYTNLQPLCSKFNRDIKRNSYEN